MKNFIYSKYNRTFYSKIFSKILNHNYMNLYEQQRLKNLVTIFLLISLIVFSIILTLCVSKVSSSTVAPIEAKSSEMSNGRVGDYEIPDPCTLDTVSCDKEEIVLTWIEPKNNSRAVQPQKKQTRPISLNSKKDINKLLPIKKGASKRTQERVDYAWSISHDKDFIYTIEAENSKWDTNTVGITKDRGICQVSPYYHPEIVNNPKFSDWKWQIDQCWKLYSGGTRFYGSDVRWKVVGRFSWIHENVDYKIANQ